jgi:hypothetical protein
MASITSLRVRRSAAQLHALAGVEREIRANDRASQRKYLQTFSEAFRSYESVLDTHQLRSKVHAADILLIGDYHALPASQRFAATLFEDRAQPGDRPVVLGVETIFSRDQHILEEWWRREIDEDELRRRIRYDLDWGYDWAPFYELLVTAREHAEAIYGLDCMPREDLRKIGARDRHAAHKIAEIRQRHPGAVIVVLFGESHLAPRHLPCLLRECLAEEKILTVLQNVDALYWLAAGEKRDRIEAVQVAQDVVCAFNATPLEKYENYRLCLTRWRKETGDSPDAGPTIYNLIDSLVRFLDIDRYSTHNGTQPKFLIDLMPEVHGRPGDLRRLLARKGITESAQQSILAQIDERGSIYVPQVNALHVRDFQMAYVAEEAARFLHHACRGLPERANGHSHGSEGDVFCRQVVEYALGYFGSRVLDPSREPVRGAAMSNAAWQMLDRAEKAANSEEPEALARQFGYVLGTDLYDDYLAGKVTRSTLRRLFLTHLEEPAVAREICRELVCKTPPARRKPPGRVVR